jgi:hypothetical protein
MLPEEQKNFVLLIILGIVTFQRLKILYLLNETCSLRRSWGLCLWLVPAAMATPHCDRTDAVNILRIQVILHQGFTFF